LLSKTPRLFRRSFTAPPLPAHFLEKIELPAIRGRIDPQILDDILSGRVFTLGGDRDEITDFEKRWRRHFFAEVPINSASPDIRAVWEPARLQHLTLILETVRRGSAAGSPDRLKSFIRSAVLEWIGRNQFLRGPHYISVMECALRIPVFLMALKILDNLAPGDRRLLAQTMFEHAWLTRRRLSLYSSRGNHTLTEAVGLILAGAVFQESAQGRDWLRTGITLLEQESPRQILDDGGPAEQSLNYHRFVLDLYWLAVDFLEKNRLHDGCDFKARLIKGERFLEAFKDESDWFPSIGDSDDGRVVAPGLHPVRGESFEKPDGQLSGAAKKAIHIRTFSQAGYTVMKTPNGLRLTFDHGPLGLAPLYNHGHADALALTLSLKGRRFLVDPGTFRYNGAPEWRRYFKGARAHNTVTIDGRDQADQLTGVVWDKSYQVVTESREISQGRLLIRAAHTGYQRLDSPVVHIRTLFFEGPGLWIIKDAFQGEGEHEFELNYHLHPDVAVKKIKDWTRLESGPVRVYMKCLEDDFVVFRGRRNPLLGWYSSAYCVIQETRVLQVRQEKPAREAVFTTVIGTAE